MVIINALFHRREVLGRARGDVEGSRPSWVDLVRGVWILGSMRYVVTRGDRRMKIVPWERKGFVHMVSSICHYLVVAPTYNNAFTEGWGSRLHGFGHDWLTE